MCILFRDCEFFTNDCGWCTDKCQNNGSFVGICVLINTQCYCCINTEMTSLILKKLTECVFQLGLIKCLDCQNKCRDYGFINGVCRMSSNYFLRCFCCINNNFESYYQISNNFQLETTTKL